MIAGTAVVAVTAIVIIAVAVRVRVGVINLGRNRGGGNGLCQRPTALNIAVTGFRTIRNYTKGDQVAVLSPGGSRRHSHGKNIDLLD